MDGQSGSGMPTTSAWPTFITTHRRVAPVVIVAAVLLGLVLVVSAGRQQLVWFVLLLFALGVVCLTFPALAWNDWLANRLAPPNSVTREWAALIIGSTAVGFAGLVVTVLWWPNQIVAGASVIVLTVGVVGVYVWVSRSASPVPPADLPWSAALNTKAHVGIVFMAGSAIGIAALGSFGGVGWILILVWLLGLMILKGGVTPFIKSRRAHIGPTLWAMFGLTAVGFVLLGVGARDSTLLGVLLGVSLVIGALSVLGLALVHCDMTPEMAWILIGVGAVGGAAGLFWARNALNMDAFGWVVGLFVWGIGTWYVFRGEGIVVVLMVGWILVWGLGDRTADVPADPHEGAAVRVLAVGDSFISGEGANEFLPGTNVAGANECRRASTAYSYVVSERLGYSLDFLACQGAKIDDLTKCGQMADDALMRRFGYLGDDPDDSQVEADRTNCTLEEVEWGDAQRELAGAASGEAAGFVPQLRYFEPAAYEEYDVVLVSIGGNDAGFSTIVKSCLLPQDCSDQQDQWAALVRAQRPRLVGLYSHLQELTGPHTKIVAMPYPPLATEEDCNLGLSANEHQFLTEHIALLETEIEAAAEEAGIEFFDGTRAAYDGHDLCDPDDPGANHLLLEPTEGSAAKRYQPGFWIHGSMHPNETGHRVLADGLVDDVEAWADEAVATKAAIVSGDVVADEVEPPPAEPPVDTGEEMTVEEQQEAELADAAQALLDDASWITDELYESVTALIAPLLALLGSGVLFAAGFLRKRNPLSNALRPRDAV